MSIEAKKEGLMRLFGTVMILSGIILSIIDAVFIFNNIFIWLIFFIIISSWLFFFILIKLEKDFIIENQIKFLIGLFLYSIFFVIIGISYIHYSIIVINPYYRFETLFPLIVLKTLLIVICWNYSLSIYKKKKKEYFS